jgi:hypothetical protein
MLRESQTAVIARNETWQGEVATEPYEAGWATEAVIFIRALALRSGSGAWVSQTAASGAPSARVQARVQLSADGMRWIDEGSLVELPGDTAQDSFVRVRHFGNWLRVAAELPEGFAIKALVTIHLK